MTEQPVFTPEEMDRHRCSYQCGRPFQFSITNVDDGTTEHLCLPDFVGLAMGIIQAAVSTGIVDQSGMLVENAAEAGSDYLPQGIGGYGIEPGQYPPQDDSLESGESFYTEDVA